MTKKKSSDYKKKIKYSSDIPWKKKRPGEKIINCPVIYNENGEPESAVNTLLYAIMKTGYDQEGYKFFSKLCYLHPDKMCGSFWVEVMGVNMNYLYKEGKLISKIKEKEQIEKNKKQRI